MATMHAMKAMTAYQNDNVRHGGLSISPSFGAFGCSVADTHSSNAAIGNKCTQRKATARRRANAACADGGGLFGQESAGDESKQHLCSGVVVWGEAEFVEDEVDAQ